jgi:hypothetical protein
MFGKMALDEMSRWRNAVASGVMLSTLLATDTQVAPDHLKKSTSYSLPPSTESQLVVVKFLL